MYIYIYIYMYIYIYICMSVASNPPAVRNAKILCFLLLCLFVACRLFVY